MVPLAVSRPVRFAALAGLFLVAGTPAFAASGIIVGDSLGVGISAASGLRNLAKNSVTIRGSRVIEQLREVPAGTLVFMSLGTNDAVGPVKGIEKSIDKVVRTARAARLRLVWLGPPCVSKAWDKNARQLDGILRERLAGTGVVYVSMRDESICSPSVRAGDGVHFNTQGYKNMWARAASAAGYQVASTSPVEAPAPKERPVAAEQPAQNVHPRVRTVVTPVSYADAAPRRLVLDRFVSNFRWPESRRFTGSFVPAE